MVVRMIINEMQPLYSHAMGHGRCYGTFFNSRKTLAASLSLSFPQVNIIISGQVNMVNSQAVPAARMFLTTTLAVVMFTVFAQVFVLHV